MGDMNCNMLVKNELTDICDIYGLNNLIKDPTCFKSCNGTAVDVILTNKSRCFSDTFNIDIGLSDFHNCIGVASKMYAPAIIKRRVNYRCMRKFDDDSFAYDVSTIPFHICNVFEDVDDISWAQHQLLMSVVNEHAPLKTKFVSGNQVPYMNSELRKAINQRNMWRGKHFRDRRNKKYRAMYVKLRNKVVKLHKQSIKTYFRQRCDTQNGNKKFFKTIKPFLTDKNSNGCGNKIILNEEDCILSRPQDVADVFNRYFISIGDYDGEPDGVDELAFHEAIEKHASHESVKLILENCSSTMEFNFKYISDGTTMKYVKQLENNKAVGHDGLSAKFIKLSGISLATSLCELFNRCVMFSHFPVDMKLAEISPVLKKIESLCKENYRSVNILTVTSKIFERIMADQLMSYFDNLLSTHLSAYRKGYSCQHAILQLTEYWRKALDEGQNVGTVAMDLSKAFDKMPHALLIAKLHAYNVSPAACNLIISYLKNRLQRVKLLGYRSQLATLNRGVPQGSVLGPLLFNIFINDLFFVRMCSNIVNYADDNHVCYKHEDTEVLCDVLKLDTNTAIGWFEHNYMDANPSKFQGIILGKDVPQSMALSAQGHDIPLSNHLKVLGVTLDQKLNFDMHIDSICLSASRQINALKRLSKFLDQDSRVLIYKSFALSNFSYSPITWIFGEKGNSTKLEKLQEQALRFVYRDNTSTYEEILKRGDFLPLSIYRLKFLAIEVYKCINNLNPTYLSDLFVHKNINYELWDRHKLEQPKFDTKKYGYRSFMYYGSKLWNLLPNDVKRSTSMYEFRGKVTEWCFTLSPNDFDIF